MDDRKPFFDTGNGDSDRSLTDEARDAVISTASSENRRRSDSWSSTWDTGAILFNSFCNGAYTVMGRQIYRRSSRSGGPVGEARDQAGIICCRQEVKSVVDTGRSSVLCLFDATKTVNYCSRARIGDT